MARKWDINPGLLTPGSLPSINSHFIIFPPHLPLLSFLPFLSTNLRHSDDRKLVFFLFHFIKIHHSLSFMPSRPALSPETARGAAERKPREPRAGHGPAARRPQAPAGGTDKTVRADCPAAPRTLTCASIQPFCFCCKHLPRGSC